MRYAAILTGPYTHLDHLGVICHLMQMPLIVTEKEALLCAQRFYPMLDVVHYSLQDMTLEFLASHFDAIFGSGQWWATELAPFFPLLFQKRMQFVYCPHGNSDKGRHAKAPPTQDIVLAYGDHMLSLLQESQALAKTRKVIVTGNLRWLFYQEHRAFFHTRTLEEIGTHLDPQKQTLLYAPTWHSKETSATFFSHCLSLITSCNHTFNLLIKWHPFLQEDYPLHIEQIEGAFRNARNVHFFSRFPLIYPLLSTCDIYLGDFSSVGYDFLAFDRPLFFLSSPQEQGSNETLLHRCGMHVPHHDICAFIQKNSEANAREFSNARKEAYASAFLQSKAPAQVRREILAALS